ncbi:MAG: hypothetical protein IJT32_00095, partial [Lachnospiraceae bacterium]|nr:hypothetical protein [Lachnospiraceae bacterium]
EAAFLSGHFGDLIDVRAEEKRREAAGHMEGLLGITPERYVCDMHPKYVSAQPLREGKTQATVYSAMQLQQKKIQHHHAHILSVMAEHHLSERVLGVAYDGTGYGDDGTIWGGEFLLCDGVSYTRAGHLLSVAMAGGDIVAKDAYASAEAYLFAAEQAGYLKGEEHPFTGKAIMKYLSDRQPADGTPDAVLRFPESRTQEDAPREADLKEKIRQKELRRAALSRDMGVAASSSVGRLFDAAAVILGLGEANHFEGQLACRLQYAAQRYERRKLKGDGSAFLAEDAGGQSAPAFGADTQGPTVLPFPIKKEPTRGGCVYIADTLRLVASLVRERNAILREMAFAFPSEEEKAQDTRNGTDKDDTRKAQMFSERMDELAFAFHEAIACMTATMCDIICGDEVPVALSGGTFANGLILRLLLPKLAAKGYTVYMNEKVPCGDGGLALGQLYAATF